VGNFHVRVHKISGIDKTTLYHNHPFNYVSIILFGGYIEKMIDNSIHKYGFLSIIRHKHSEYHRIIRNRLTYTLFISYNRYEWNAINIISGESGMFERYVNGKKVWCRKENGIFMIGNIDKNIAEKETRCSIYQA
jgi:hypothetical protein